MARLSLKAVASRAAGVAHFMQTVTTHNTPTLAGYPERTSSHVADLRAQGRQTFLRQVCGSFLFPCRRHPRHRLSWLHSVPEMHPISANLNRCYVPERFTDRPLIPVMSHQVWPGKTATAALAPPSTGSATPLTCIRQAK